MKSLLFGTDNGTGSDTPDDIDVNAALQKLFSDHGVELAAYEDWLMLNNEPPAIRGAWYPPKEPSPSGQFDVEVCLPDGRVIYECFAGIGGDAREALRNGFENFVISDLHVLLAALWGVVNEDQVTIENWQIGSKQWVAYLGPYATRAFDGGEAKIPDSVFENIKRQLQAENLEPGLHWVRTFYCNIDKAECSSEALIDNEPWQAGIEAQSNSGWERTSHVYMVRNFYILKSC